MDLGNLQATPPSLFFALHMQEERRVYIHVARQTRVQEKFFYSVILHKNAYSFSCDDVRVCPIDIGVGMVAEGVLVDPCQHRGSVEEIVS